MGSPSSPLSPLPSKSRPSRQERLAQALRENLKRRKIQERLRDTEGEEVRDKPSSALPPDGLS